MDKPKILIKINGKERSFSETTTDEQIKKAQNSQTEIRQELKNHQPPSPILKDYEIAEEEIAAANEEREFEWILPQPHQLEDEPYDKLVKPDPAKKKSKPIIGTLSFPRIQKKRNKSTYPFKTLFLAILSALVIGTSFGMVVLHLFTEDLAQPAFEVTQPTEPAGASEDEGANKDPENSQTNMTSITLPPLDVFLVQGGVYSIEDAATPIINQLKEDGFAGTVINQDGKYYLFLGIGISDLAGKALKTPYETAGQETYVKALSIPEVTTEGDPSMVTAEKLFNHLILYSSNKFTSTPESVNWDEIKTTYDELASKETDSSFVNTVLESYKAVESYHGSSSNTDFWSSQQALLNSMQEYQKWISEQRN
jgi:stage II sporulation protein B